MNSCAGWWCRPTGVASWSSIIANAQQCTNIMAKHRQYSPHSMTYIPATLCIQRASGCNKGWCIHWYTRAVRMYIMTMQAPTSRTYWDSRCPNLILGSNNATRQPNNWISKKFEITRFFVFPKNLVFSFLLKIPKYPSNWKFVIVKNLRVD